eukprot:MONOS_1158.1-p1 / transcript=MONOS_1158.1 / gene=MONOS_1158 / organism=Monocercomonoides_exilis_PA203 / gene_product=unspecified product / transcript_product=unspecified product / location=Mono_scaffold00019:212890-214638(-) / protein_length=583 / sequence_SO=supercontig / SO=protein_coding / is_pseudo=false
MNVSTLFCAEGQTHNSVLEMKDCKTQIFYATSSRLKLRCTLIIVKGSSLIINNCTFSDFTINTPFILTQNTYFLRIENSSFSNFYVNSPLLSLTFAPRFTSIHNVRCERSHFDEYGCFLLINESTLEITNCAIQVENNISSTLSVNSDSWIYTTFTCGWNGSIINLYDVNGNMENTSISHASFGALAVSNCEISFRNMLFISNKPMEYPVETSAERNAICTDSNIFLRTMSEWMLPENESESESIYRSMWFISNNCNASSNDEQQINSLFRPRLREVTAEIIEHDIHFTYIGSDIFPCNLKHLVETIKSGISVSKFILELDYIVNESMAEGSIPLTVFEKASDYDEVDACLVTDYDGRKIYSQKIVLGNISHTTPMEEPSIFIPIEKKPRKTMIICFVVSGVLLLLSLIIAVFMILLSCKTRKITAQLHNFQTDKRKRKRLKTKSKHLSGEDSHPLRQKNNSFSRTIDNDDSLSTSRSQLIPSIPVLTQPPHPAALSRNIQGFAPSSQTLSSNIPSMSPNASTSYSILQLNNTTNQNTSSSLSFVNHPTNMSFSSTFSGRDDPTLMGELGRSSSPIPTEIIN